MSEIKIGKIARYLTAIFGFVFLLIAGLAILIGTNFPLGKDEALVITVFIALFLPYFFIGWVLRKNAMKWNIGIEKDEDGTQKGFKGPPLISLYIGFIWRTLIVGIILNAIGSLIKTMYGNYLDEGTENSLKIIIYILNVYFSFYWLILAQYGSFKIKSLSEINRSKKSITIDNNGGLIRDMNTTLKETLIGLLATFTTISFFVLSILQVFAVYDFFRHYWEWSAIGSFFAAIFIGPIPRLGSLAGVIAASKLWNWEIIYAVLLFFYPIAFYLLILILGGSAAVFSSLFIKKEKR